MTRLLRTLAATGAALILSLGLLATPAQAGYPTTLLKLTNLNNTLEEFRVQSSYVYHRWQTSPNGSWTGWTLLHANSPKVLTGLSGERNADGRLEIFAHGRDLNNVYHIWQNAPSSGWSNWQSLGGVISTSEPGVRSYLFSGQIQIVVRGSDGNLHTKFQQQPSCCWTTNWQFVVT